MKEIIQGTYDYIKDCWHDFWYWFWDKIECWAFGRVKRTYCWKQNDGCYTKEGSLRFYILQRKYTNEVKRERQ